jgi:hypothetical protein
MRRAQTQLYIAGRIRLEFTAWIPAQIDRTSVTSRKREDIASGNSHHSF